MTSATPLFSNAAKGSKIISFNDRVLASTPSPGNEYEDYTYIEGLKEWIGRSNLPHPKADEAIKQLKALEVQN